MALTSALFSTITGIQNTEARINILAGNVSNADKPGFTRKELETNYVSVNGQTNPLQSTIQTVNYNIYLLDSLIEDASVAALNSITSDFLNQYSRDQGSIDGDNSISAFSNDLAKALDRLSVTPEDTSLKNFAVSEADRLAIELNRLSGAVQGYRLQADQEIERTVTEINQIIERIEEYNQVITQASALGQSTANLVDERHTALEELSQLIEMDYFTNNQNEVQIYVSGRPLLDSRARVIEYDAATALDKNTIYPAGFNPIDLDGFDLTPFLQSGEIGGLIDIRDGFMVEEQAKLDEFARVLIEQMNVLVNSGASIPPPAVMEGSLEGLTGGTPLGATGTVRIATTDADGVVQNATTLNLAGILDVADLITAINTALGPDVTASFGANQEFVLTANNAGEGISINELTSSFPPTGSGFSNRFGLNNMFDGDGADNISVSQYLIDNPENLATSRMNAAAGVGATAIFIGDSSLTSQMNDVFTTNYSFNAAGNFSAQTENLFNYIDKIIGDTAYQASNAELNRDITISLMQQTKNTLQNISGVNIDEEMANLIDLEAKYEAAATMIATIQEMFDALLAAVR